jgi:hypothetical protein
MALILLILLIVAGLAAYIRPFHDLDLNYTEVDWRSKLLTIIQTQETALTLNEDELNNLAKKGIAERALAADQPYRIEGADFGLNGNELTADVIVQWGLLRAEATALYTLSFEGGKLLLTPESVKVRGMTLSPSLFKLKAIEVDAGQYLPQLIQITDVKFEGHSLKIEFAVDWSQLPSLLR